MPASLPADILSSIFQGYQRSLSRSLTGLTPGQLHFQPTSEANSIAWLLWHLSRWQDRQLARMAHEAEVWTVPVVAPGTSPETRRRALPSASSPNPERWHTQFALPADRHGMGDTAAQVAAFRPDPTLLTAYAAAVHAATLRRIELLTPRLTEPFQYLPQLPVATIHASLVAVSRDTGEHTGQIAYLRGLVTHTNWNPHARLY